MRRSERERYDVRAEVMKALAHPSRLLIVDKLAGGELCVRELTDLVGADISTVSKHLSLLREAGIVASEKRGLQVFYNLKCDCIPQFFECIESVLGKDSGCCAEAADGRARGGTCRKRTCCSCARETPAAARWPRDGPAT